jgi:hypothetical protein
MPPSSPEDAPEFAAGGSLVRHRSSIDHQQGNLTKMMLRLSQWWHQREGRMLQFPHRSECGNGGAVGLVDSMTCPIVWLPTYSEEQAFYERL